MQDLRDTSLTRSENGPSSDCLSFQGNGIGASVPDEDTSSLHYPDRSTSNREKMKSHRPWAKDRDAQHPHSSKNRSIASGASLSDTHMASRRAEQAANRRMLAAMWLQEIVGVTSLSNEPSEEELRLCLRNGLVLCNAINKVQPGAVPKVWIFLFPLLTNAAWLPTLSNFIPDLKATLKSPLATLTYLLENFVVHTCILCRLLRFHPFQTILMGLSLHISILKM
jgi:hypothetical protein